MTKLYSELALAIDLIQEVYKTSNPIIIAEKAEEELGVNITIHQVEDYLDITNNEDYEKESNKVEYYQTHY